GDTNVGNTVGSTRHRRGPDLKEAVIRHGVAAVCGKVQQDPLQLHRVGFDHSVHVIRPQGHANLVTYQADQHPFELQDECVDIGHGGLAASWFVHRDQFVRDVKGAVDRAV